MFFTVLVHGIFLAQEIRHIIMIRFLHFFFLRNPMVAQCLNVLSTIHFNYIFRDHKSCHGVHFL